MTFKDELDKVYILRDIRRYNNIFKIQDESVAEHSFFVALTLLLLSKYYAFDVVTALKMALVHDLAEIDVTDVPHNVKQRFPKLQEVLEECEIKAIEKYDRREFVELNKELLEGKTFEAKIVKFADNLSCVQYSGNEIKLGNTGYMNDVYEKSFDRAKKQKEELKQYEIQSYSIANDRRCRQKR